MKIKVDYQKNFPLKAEGYCDNCHQINVPVSLMYGLCSDLYCYLCESCFEYYNDLFPGTFSYCAGCGAHLCGMAHSYPTDSILNLQLRYCKNCQSELILMDASKELEIIVHKAIEEIDDLEKKSPKKNVKNSSKK